jgi:hypothetical protein
MTDEERVNEMKGRVNEIRSLMDTNILDTEILDNILGELEKIVESLDELKEK